MARRSRGDGTVFFDSKRGCWVGQVDAGRDPETGRRRRPKVSAATKDECKELVRQLLAEKARTGIVARRDVTVESVVRARLANPPARVKSGITVRVHENHGARIIAALGKKRLAKLTPRDVDQFLQQMADDGYARKTISDTRALLADAIRRAERDGLTGRNVALLADMPAAATKKSRSMTLEQAARLLGSLAGDPWTGALAAVGITCGLRPGELLGLRWQDTDFGQGVIRVRYSLKAGGVLGELKTPESKRTMVMPARAAAALKALRAQQAQARLRLGAAYTDLDLVFAREDGTPTPYTAAYKKFVAACSKAGIGGDWHPHEMRHTFVSLLSANGVDMEAIADAVGHENSAITKAVYRHQISDTVAQAASVMDSIFGGTS